MFPRLVHESSRTTTKLYNIAFLIITGELNVEVTLLFSQVYFQTLQKKYVSKGTFLDSMLTHTTSVVATCSWC